MIAFLERFSRKAKAEGVWNGILVGDISQPRGGPMLTGHASHQVGLDADVWLTPMPDHTLSLEERENMSAVNMVTEDGLSVDRRHWTPAQAGIIKAAAEEPEVDRIFVNAAIKKALCETAKGEPWMNKVRAYWGHNYHFHIRIKCPARRCRLPAAGSAAARRRLRQVACLVVHRRGAASARRAQTADHHGPAAARMPKGRAGEIGRRLHALGVAARLASAMAEPVGERQNAASRRRRSDECRQANKARGRYAPGGP